MAPALDFQCHGASISVRNTFLHAEDDEWTEEQPVAVRSKTAPGGEACREARGAHFREVVEELVVFSGATTDCGSSEDDDRCEAVCGDDATLEGDVGDELQPAVLPRVVTRDGFDSPFVRDAGERPLGEPCFFGACYPDVAQGVAAPAWGSAALWAPVESTMPTLEGLSQCWAWQPPQQEPQQPQQQQVFFLQAAPEDAQPFVVHMGGADACSWQEMAAAPEVTPPNGAASLPCSSSWLPPPPPTPAPEVADPPVALPAPPRPAASSPRRTAAPERRGARRGEREEEPSGRTTVMLKNLPNNYSRATLVSMIEAEGFMGRFDFLYFPIDFRTHAALGYAFLNLVTPEDAEEFRQRFNGFSRWSLPSSKVCSVAWSHPHQGLEAHVARYRNSPLFHDSVPDAYRPVLFQDGKRVPFPEPTKRIKPPRQGTERMLV